MASVFKASISYRELEQIVKDFILCEKGVDLTNFVLTKKTDGLDVEFVEKESVSQSPLNLPSVYNLQKNGQC